MPFYTVNLLSPSDTLVMAYLMDAPTRKQAIYRAMSDYRKLGERELKCAQVYRNADSSNAETYDLEGRRL